MWYSRNLVTVLLLLVKRFSDVDGIVTVTTSAVTGVPKQQPLTLRCSYTADEVVLDYIWSRKTVNNTYTEIVSGSVLGQTATFQDTWQNKGVFVGDYTSTLDIQLPPNYVTSSFAETYICQVNGVANTGSSEVTALVLSRPTISGIPSPYQVIESTRLRIDCSSYTTVGNPPATSYTWTKGGSPVSSTNGVLDINSISKDQRGQYTCTATNTQGSDSATTTIDVQYSPTTSVVPSTYQVIESSHLRIDCRSFTTVGNPSTTSYTWTKGGSTVSTDCVLDISSIRKDQAGQYTCTATNTLTPTGGSPQQWTATGQVNVDIQYAPIISGIPSPYQMIESTSLRIDCTSFTTMGNPSATSYTWTKRGSPVASTDGVLDINNISRSQAGQYICTATNTLTPTGGPSQQGTATGQVTVYVQYGPTLSDFPSTYRVNKSSHLKIDCSSYATVGNPPATSYTWTYEGAIVSTGAVLDINNISKNQAGQYTCTATNTLTPTGGPQQQGTTTGQVNVQFVPEVPEDLLAWSTGPHTIKLSWKVTSLNLKNQQFVIEYKEDGLDWKKSKEIYNETGEVYVQGYITNLKPETLYFVRVSSVTDIGSSNFTEEDRVLTKHSTQNMEEFANSQDTNTGKILTGIGIVMIILGIVFAAIHILVFFKHKRSLRTEKQQRYASFQSRDGNAYDEIRRPAAVYQNTEFSAYE